jgi:hypothetical protein
MCFEANKVKISKYKPKPHLLPNIDKHVQKNYIKSLFEVNTPYILFGCTKELV